MGRRAVLQSDLISLMLAADGSLLYVTNTVLTVAQERESVLERGVELYNSVSSANILCRTDCRSVISDRRWCVG